MNNERELEVAVQLIYTLTKEYVDNRTNYITYLFNYAHRDAVCLNLNNPPLVSENAYELFYELTDGKDIRDSSWQFVGRFKELGKRLFTWEHFTPAKIFKQNLINAYKGKLLTTELIKDLILEQKGCWITKREDEELSRLGYRTNRPNPHEAYVKAGIKIKLS